MSEAQTAADESEQKITLEGEDGTSYDCKYLDCFEFEGNDYALLLKPAEEGDDEDEETLVIMRVHQRGGDTIFQIIETQEEFDKVVAYVENMVENMQEDDEDEE